MAGSFPTVTLDDYDMIPLETLVDGDEETWLYVLETRVKTSVECSFDLKLPSNSHQASVTSNIHQVTDNYAIETEMTGKKVIDTRTFTRPRKNRSSGFSPAVFNETAIIRKSEINCNETFTQLIDYSPPNQSALTINQTLNCNSKPDTNGVCNGTFLLDGLSPGDDCITNNNNDIVLNATFSGNGVSQPVKNQDLNATFNVDAQSEDSPESRDDFTFKKPIFTRGLKAPLARTSTLKDEVFDNQISPLKPAQNGAEPRMSSTPMMRNRMAVFSVNDIATSPISGISQDQRYYSDESLPDSVAVPAEATKLPAAQKNSPQASNHSGKSPTENLRYTAEPVPNSPPSSSLGSRYSSQSLESDSAPVPSREEVVHRSMPDLKSSQNATNLPNPALDGRNLNRLHGSETGLRLPSSAAQYGARPKTQLRLPQPRATPPAEVPKIAGGRTIPAPLAPAPSGLRMPGIRKPGFSAPSIKPDILNSTFNMETMSVAAAAVQVAADVASVPRPRMSKIPGPRGIPAPTVSTSKLRFIRPPSYERK